MQSENLNIGDLLISRTAMKFKPKIFLMVILLAGCAPGISISPHQRSSHITNHQFYYERDIGEVANMINREIILSDSTFISEQNQRLAKQYYFKGISKINSNDTNDLRMAKQCFKATLALDNTYTYVWELLGDIVVHESQLNKDSVKTNNLNEAIYFYSKAIESDSTGNTFFYKRGLCYKNLGDSVYVADYRKACGLGNAEACAAIGEIEKK